VYSYGHRESERNIESEGRRRIVTKTLCRNGTYGVKGFAAPRV
jgi:hypothetical protein